MAKDNGDGTPAKAKAKKEPTEYHVFRQLKARELVEGGPTEIGPDTFEFIATVKATSDGAAKKAVFAEVAKAALAAGGGELVETLVAVPTRSWDPQPHRQVLEPKILVG